MSPFILIYTLKRPLRSFVFFALSLGASAFFWFPAIHDLQFTKATITQVATFNSYFLGRDNLIPLLGFIIPLIFLVSLFLTRARQEGIFYFSFILVAISLFMALPLSIPIWESLPLFSQTIQFPWRFLALSTFGSSILLAIIFTRFSILRVFFPILIYLSLLLSPLNIKQTFHPESYYSTNDDSTTVKNEYMSKWVKINPTIKADSFFEVISGKANILSRNLVDVSSETKLRVNQIYFPGLNVKIDTKPAIISYDNDWGLVELTVPEGKHQIEVYFTETPARLWADIVSLTSLFILLAIIGIPNLKLLKRRR